MILNNDFLELKGENEANKLEKQFHQSKTKKLEEQGELLKKNFSYEKKWMKIKRKINKL